jgi:hypothetical protein
MHKLSRNSEYGEEFAAAFGIGQLQEFWTGVGGCPQLASEQARPLIQRADFREKTIPLFLHQDGAAFQDRDSLDTLSMGGVLAENTQTLGKHFLLASWPKSCCVAGSDGTWSKIWAWLLWSFTALLDGMHPNADPWGNPFDPTSDRGQLANTPIIAGGLRAAVFVVTGDMKEFQDTFGLAHQAAEAPCHLCQANRTTHFWTDFRPGAPWMQTAPKLPGSEHPVMTIASVWHFGLDMMHVMELGVTSHAIGNLFFDLVYCQLPGPRAQAFHSVWTEILNCYSSFNVPHDRRITNLALKNFTDASRPNKQYPMLTGLKAAEVRGLVEIAEHLATTVFVTESEEHRRRATMFKALAKVYRICDEAGTFLSPRASSELCNQMDIFLLTYSWFAKQCERQGELRWNIVPKFHYAWHLSRMAKWLNPKVYRCYSGEDFVGRMSRLAHTCTPGIAGYRLSHGLLAKYTVGMHIRITRGDHAD